MQRRSGAEHCYSRRRGPDWTAVGASWIARDRDGRPRTAVSGQSRRSPVGPRSTPMRQLNASSRVATHVIEVITPRTNTARLSPAEHLFAAIGADAAMDEGPVAFEIAGDQERRRFLVRTGSRAQQQLVAAQFGGAYPQAALRS